MASLKLTLDKRSQKKDNSYPLVFRISINGESRSIPTGHSILEKDWNWKSNFLKKTHPTFDLLSDKIKGLELSHLTKIMQYEKKYPFNANAQELKDYILCAPKTVSKVDEFWQEEIDLMQKANRNGGARTYMETLVALKKIRNMNVRFEQIDYRWLKEVEAELISKGVKINSIGLYYRTLRAVYNKAINAEVVSFDHYPFRRYRIRKEQTTPHPISLEELQKYFRLQIDKDSWLYDSWLMGKLMFMLIGINFKDMVLMRESDIRSGRLIYSRAKTRTIYSIKLLPEALQILEHFKGRDNHTLLGKVTSTEMEDKIRFPLVIRQKNHVFNHHLSELGKIIECKEKLRGYVFRYTWANLAKQLGYSKDMIGEGLGHQQGNKVTEIYLQAFNPELIDKMNEKIFNKVNEEVLIA